MSQLILLCVCVYTWMKWFIFTDIFWKCCIRREIGTHTQVKWHTHTQVKWLGSQSFLRRLGSQSFHWLSDFCSCTAFSKCIREYKSFHSRIHSSTQAWVSLRQIPVISLVCVCVYVWEINLCTRIYSSEMMYMYRS